MPVAAPSAASPTHYVDIAVRLTADPEFMRSVRAGIRERADVLFEDLRVLREFERFFLEAHQVATSAAAGS